MSKSSELSSDGMLMRSRSDTRKLQQDAMQHYNMTVAMLNKSMGLCLR